MTRLRAFILCILLVFGAGLWGCGGGGAELKSRTTTTGQELIDLKSAYDRGVITKDQYESQKERILEGE